MTSIEENNRMIAEFMGGKSRVSERYGLLFRLPGKAGEFGEKAQPMLYHTSWDWLMSVVDKIETIKLPHPSIIPVSVQIRKKSCTIHSGQWDDSIPLISVYHPSGKGSAHTKKQVTYEAVVKFIKWYNQNQSI